MSTWKLETVTSLITEVQALVGWAFVYQLFL